MMLHEPTLSKYLHAKGARLGLPISGTFELTARCNFNCKMCYVHLTEAEQKAQGSELTAAQWLSLAEELREAGTVFLLLTGGEPTLRPDFPELYSELKKLGFVLTINTNGYLLRGGLRELLLRDPPNRVNITLYGADNETYRRLCGVAAFDTICDNVRALREGGISVKLNLSLLPENAPELPALLKTAQALGASTQAAAYMFPPRRRGKTDCDCRLSPEEAGRFQAEYERLVLPPQELAAKRETLRAGLRPENDEACDGAVGEGMRCRAGSTSFWITWDGRLLPCGQMLTPAVPLRAQPFADAWKTLRAQAAAIRLPPRCAACGIAHACHVCAAMCYGENGSFGKTPDYLCCMTEAYLSEFLNKTEEAT